VIDEDRPLPHPGKRAKLAEGDAAQVVVVADAGEDELGLARRLGLATQASALARVRL
jgi:hypothetical protein